MPAVQGIVASRACPNASSDTCLVSSKASMPMAASSSPWLPLVFFWLVHVVHVRVVLISLSFSFSLSLSLFECWVDHPVVKHFSVRDSVCLLPHLHPSSYEFL